MTSKAVGFTFMLTRVLYGDGKNFWFVIDEGEERKSQIYKFIVALTPDEWKKIVRVLDAINTKPMTYMHQEKFKQLEGKIWEIKQREIRIACYWQIRGELLVGVYGLRKKANKWSKNEIDNARGWYNFYKEKDFRGAING